MSHASELTRPFPENSLKKKYDFLCLQAFVIKRVKCILSGEHNFTSNSSMFPSFPPCFVVALPCLFPFTLPCFKKFLTFFILLLFLLSPYFLLSLAHFPFSPSLRFLSCHSVSCRQQTNSFLYVCHLREFFKSVFLVFEIKIFSLI